ncbi:putative soluble pyridine nucleotide transhydrogenase [Candidatus Filomicrobium marinum]|uniref:Soluble pyridine nucleotide transhydrogenase n=2 Tax=Candidatus Filomicrobium marinum TaxID=1608628 RepID=A0A0D6JG67_9HYPH|nr:putative soluble pyridine nucleotide transhydrogenase [Candidatus Filomicrobium marinum]CPR20024.1 putative soluble pyridine nucleotide transhydrogenase [Candidatus Filomicrobium marinum]
MLKPSEPKGSGDGNEVSIADCLGRNPNEQRYVRHSWRVVRGEDLSMNYVTAQNTYDVIVIGSGPAGRRAAVQSAKLGKSVLVVEKNRRVGGVSLHTGTIPSKTLRETVLNLTGWRERGFYGRSYRVKKDIRAVDLLSRQHKTLDHEVEVLEHQFQRNGVTTIYGTARFVDTGRVEVMTAQGSIGTYRAERFVIAVGTRPFRPDYVPFNQVTVLDTDDIIQIDHIPRSMAIIGAGVIGVEYASIFSALDVQVTLIEPRTSILDFVDSEIIAEFTHEMRDRGVAMRLGSTVEQITLSGMRPIVQIAGGRSVHADMLLFAAGRVGATSPLNLEAIGLAVDHRGRVTVDSNTFQTSVPHIYAVGDVIGFPSLASTSMEQGRIAACHAFGVPPPPAPEYFPYGIYAVPEISTVGMSEAEVAGRGIAYECGIARFRETSRGQIMGIQSGMMKMIFSIKTGRLLGCHILGEGATELIHIGQAVINLKGTIDFFLENTFNYPTLAEAYKIAALDAWNRMAMTSRAMA